MYPPSHIARVVVLAAYISQHTAGHHCCSHFLTNWTKLCIYFLPGHQVCLEARPLLGIGMLARYTYDNTPPPSAAVLGPSLVVYRSDSQIDTKKSAVVYIR